MKQIINGLRELPTLAMEINTISQHSKIKYNKRAPVSPPPNTYDINS